MISRINKILNEAKRDGKNICLGTDEYKDLVKGLNKIAPQFVSMLFEMGCVKSDLVNIKGNRFCGFRANLELNDDNYHEFLDYISKLDIQPSLIFINGLELDLFFKPNRKINLISNEDYLLLIYSFIEYLKQYEELGLKFTGWNLDFDDMVECDTNKEVDILFNKEAFDTVLVEWESLDNSKIVCPGEEELIIL
ncbi:TPA: hypothetical protein ACP6IR_002000 [Clostridioides difficile]|nr:hypothetical protein [Clostridioides difficile]HBH3656768.1 hypothetical protein [Clostridioides difficile]